jgi:hypothetical protein
MGATGLNLTCIKIAKKRQSNIRRCYFAEKLAVAQALSGKRADTDAPRIVVR